MRVQCSYCKYWTPKTVRSQILEGECSVLREYTRGTFLCPEFELIKLDKLESENKNEEYSLEEVEVDDD